jgi:hypothetical protein
MLWRIASLYVLYVQLEICEILWTQNLLFAGGLSVIVLLHSTLQAIHSTKLKHMHHFGSQFSADPVSLWKLDRSYILFYIICMTEYWDFSILMRVMGWLQLDECKFCFESPWWVRCYALEWDSFVALGLKAEAFRIVCCGSFLDVTNWCKTLQDQNINPKLAAI